jgi:hypothetical protein
LIGPQRRVKVGPPAARPIRQHDQGIRPSRYFPDGPG